MVVIIDGIEYAPKVDAPVIDAQLNECLKFLVDIQYFSGCTHKHKAWAWGALNALSPQLAALAADNPKLAYDFINKNS